MRVSYNRFRIIRNGKREGGDYHSKEAAKQVFDKLDGQVILLGVYGGNNDWLAWKGFPSATDRFLSSGVARDNVGMT